MRSHYTRGPYDETRLCDTVADSMKTSIAFIAAAVLALSPLTGLAHEPKPVGDFGSGEHSAVSSGAYGQTAQAQQQQDDDEPDVTQMVLLTLAAAAIAAVLSLIGYVIRQRTGFWLHRPPPRDSSAPDDHH